MPKSKTRRRPTPTSQKAPALYPCSHCRTERIVAPLSLLVGLNRQHPVPGLGDALAALVAMCGSDELAAICPGCMCLTTDLDGC